jgi:deoxyribodipyrimidine photo-lyase
MDSAREFPPNRAAALARLDAFAPGAGAAYAAGRNTDPGPDAPGATSRLAPYLRYRVVTEREVVARVLAQHRAPAAEKFVQEVLWRTYWKGWLEQRPAVWRRFLEARDAARTSWRDDRAIREAEEGRTGIEGFDDWARELAGRGYLHNHARMWFASIWIFTLRLPWALGADLFLRHLVDADPASNTLSWRWVAGLQTRGKAYVATAENIARFTNGRFAPRGLARDAFAIDDDVEPAPRPLPLAADGAPPRAGASPSLLLVTHEDLHPESVFASPDATRAIRAALVVSDPERLWGDAARAFVAGASADAAARVASHFGCASHVAASLDAATLLDAARAAGVRRIVTAHPPVGPVADALQGAAAALEADGVTLERARRPWDAACWPHAQRGFFPFKERMPRTLAELGLELR